MIHLLLLLPDTQVRERHQLKEQERFLLKTLTPGPGQYLGMNAARMLKPVRAFKIRTTSGKPPPDPSKHPMGTRYTNCRTSTKCYLPMPPSFPILS